MSDLIHRLVTIAEDLFDCDHGPEKAFFTFPQRDGEDIFVPYKTYSVRGMDLQLMEQWFIDEVLVPLSVQEDIEAGALRLYWRLRTCFDVELDTTDGMYTLRTRLAVLDDDLNPVVAKACTPEGHRIPTV